MRKRKLQPVFSDDCRAYSSKFLAKIDFSTACEHIAREIDAEILSVLKREYRKRSRIKSRKS